MKRSFGTSIDASQIMHCGTCQLRDICCDPKKKKAYACSLYQGTGDDPSSKDFLNYMRNLVTSESVLVDPHGIDDISAPLAPNFYRWCTSSKFLNARPMPFPWQLQSGIKLFNDSCPWCSDKDWYEDIPFDCDPEEIPERIRLRKNGRCPECGRTVNDGIKAGLEHDVQNFIGVLGQRCVTGDTLIWTEKGETEIGQLAENISEFGWHDISIKIRSHGKMELATKLYIAPPNEELYRIKLYDDTELTGTGDHPIECINIDNRKIWVKLKDLSLYQYVNIYSLGEGNCIGRTLIKTIQRVPASVTYDLHIPSKHSFQTNTFMSHNSGKCLTSSTLVPTNNGLKSIANVVVGDQVIIRGKEHAVSQVHKTKSRKVGVLTTHHGYSVEGTPEHQIQTPAGWQPIRLAYTVMVRAEVVPSLNRYRWYKKWRDSTKPLASAFEYSITENFVVAFSEAPEEIKVKAIRRLVIHEDIHLSQLMLTLPSEYANKVQQVLLSMRIFCLRQNNQLLLSQPWASRYLKRVGIKNARVYAYIWLSRRIGAVSIGAGACDNLARLLALQGYREILEHPALLNSVKIFYGVSLHREVTRADAAKIIPIIKKLPSRDVFLKHILLEALIDIKQGTILWDEVNSFKRTTRETVYDITIPSAGKFIANGLEVHNSTDIGHVNSYLTHRLLKLKNPSAFYGIKANTILDANFVGITFTNAIKAMWRPMLTTIMDSPWFCIAEGSKVKLVDGTTKNIENIEPGEIVATLDGSGVVDQVYDNGTRDIVEIELADGKVLRLTDDHEIRCVVNGELVWIPIRSIDENIVIVVEDEYDVRKMQNRRL